MLIEPQHKYRPFQPVDLAGRTWPDKTLTQAPIWMSTDLRDGNQALFEPMNADRKMRLFQMLLRIGFKEIEVAFPSASQTDFDFVRHLIEGGHIPEDVTISVLTHGREPLIRRTMESLRGAKRAIVHLVNPTAPVFRKTVFGLGRAGVTEIAVGSARLIRDLAAEQPGTDWMFEYSPETFTATEMDFARDICDAVTEVWQPTPARKVIINLPATVEIATPNRFADQIEWMHRSLARRDGIILSIHPHNDRGTAVAAAEQALLAGAERVEGTLFGNGERTGNVDLVTLALNLYSQGVAPGLDFSDINTVARLTEQCTQLPVPARHPYAGDLVFTAFSGSHQDAIKKGMALHRPGMMWEMPYLPVDPADLGRSYDSIIRVNSQSGKGGIAYLLETEYGIALPRRLQVEFSALVQGVADGTGCEVTAEDIRGLFERDYLHCQAPLSYIGHRLIEDGTGQGIMVSLAMFGETVVLSGKGNGPIDALLDALKPRAMLHSYEERSLSVGAGASAIAFAEFVAADVTGAVHGVGIDSNLVTASLLAVLSSLNRAYARLPEDRRRGFFAAVTAC